jgi:hypothetical protein
LIPFQGQLRVARSSRRAGDINGGQTS